MPNRRVAPRSHPAGSARGVGPEEVTHQRDQPFGVDALVGTLEVRKRPPARTEQGAALDRGPIVGDGRPVRGAGEEEDLALTVAVVLEVELGGAREHDRAERVEGDPGLLGKLAARGGLWGLTRVDAAAGGEPPRALLGAGVVVALQQEQAPEFVNEEHASGVPLEDPALHPAHVPIIPNQCAARWGREWADRTVWRDAPPDSHAAMKHNALVLTPSLALAVALAGPPAFAAVRPAAHVGTARRGQSHRGARFSRRVEVSTQFSARLTNMSGAAMGGTEQQVELTLIPSSSVVYDVGAVTVAATATACNPAATYGLPATNTAPGSYAVPVPLEVAISFTPPCGGEVRISYSGGTYRKGGVRYVLAPDTWTIAPNESQHPEILRQP